MSSVKITYKESYKPITEVALHGEHSVTIWAQESTGKHLLSLSVTGGRRLAAHKEDIIEFCEAVIKMAKQ